MFRILIYQIHRIHFIGLARSSLIEEDIDSNEIQSPKIPFYLLYKQLKYC